MIKHTLNRLWMRISLSITAIQQDYLYDVQFLTLTTLIVGVVGGILLGRWLSRPVERLVTATKAIASQELTHRVEVKGAQEITDLADNFNRMAASLAHSEQLRRNMMADVSHELLTPLTVLQGNLRAILDDVYELNKDEIGKLYEQNKHLIRLVRDLRQLSQAEAGQLPLNITTVDINALASEATAIFMPLAAEQKVRLACDFAPNPPAIQADPDHLRQVLHNLIANALRHTPAGSLIEVSTVNCRLMRFAWRLLIPGKASTLNYSRTSLTAFIAPKRVAAGSVGARAWGWPFPGRLSMHTTVESKRPAPASTRAACLPFSCRFSKIPMLLIAKI